MLEIYENILKEKRGWISKIPENKKAVILLSGGLDSVSTIARSIIEFDISIYPLFINRGQTNINMEKKSALYFNDFFIKKFPKKYNNIFEVNVDIPLKNLKNDLQNYMHNNGYPLRDTLL